MGIGDKKMIAKFTNLNEALVVSKNTSLKKFVYSTFSEKLLNDSILKNIVDGRSGYSVNLTDDKPGDWCIMQTEDYKYIVVSCSKQVYSISTFQEYANQIVISRFTEDKRILGCCASFSFEEFVCKDTIYAEASAKFMRKLMHSSQVLGGDYRTAHRLFQRESQKSHSWWSE